MLETQNAPNREVESVSCYLGGCNDVPNHPGTLAQSLAMPGPILRQHWFRGSDLLEVAR